VKIWVWVLWVVAIGLAVGLLIFGSWSRCLCLGHGGFTVLIVIVAHRYLLLFIALVVLNRGLSFLENFFNFLLVLIFFFFGSFAVLFGD
jgi:hypothetical protein